MTRNMQDSVNTSSFTAGADLYAGYVLSDTGQGYNNYASMVQRFPNAGHVSICTRFNATAQVLDFEAGTTGTSAANAQQAVQWVVQMRQKGINPTVYVQQSLWVWLQSFFTSNKVAQPNWWIAHTGTGPTMIPGAVAHQYTFNLPANPYDTSIVADYWPGIDDGDVPSGGGTPIPEPKPEPEPIPEEYMQKDVMFKVGDGADAGQTWILMTNGYYIPVYNKTEVGAYQSVGAIIATGDSSGASITGPAHEILKNKAANAAYVPPTS